MRAVIMAACLTASAAPCRAQSTAAAASAAGVTVSAGYEIHRDHLQYTFENRSNIDTEFLVPHTFTQTYVANNQWLTVSAVYSVGSNRLETEFALTPERQTPGSDLDTFYDPNNDVVVSGTAGDVLIRSLRVAQWSDGRLWGLPWRMGYRYRRDRAQFLPTDRVLTHSNPRSEVRSPTYGHETTFSQVHEIPIEVSKPSNLSPGWALVIGAQVSPLIWARLTTILPDKYPGQDLVFDAKAIGTGGRVQMVRRKGRWPVVLTVDYGRTWSYSSARQFNRNTLQASVGVGFIRSQP